jgi:hypothetical protein
MCTDSADLARQLPVSSREIPLPTPSNGTPMARPLQSLAAAHPSFGLMPGLVLKVVREWRSHGQDSRDRTAGPMPAAMRWGRAGTLRTASAGLEGSETSPLMLFQQSAELGVLHTQGSLCIAHAVMIADRHDARPARRE